MASARSVRSSSIRASTGAAKLDEGSLVAVGGQGPQEPAPDGSAAQAAARDDEYKGVRVFRWAVSSPPLDQGHERVLRGLLGILAPIGAGQAVGEQPWRQRFKDGFQVHYR